jgi:hypothetical protein
MIRVKIEGSTICSWESFHDVFATVFGFPEFYGRNMNAWIDCMSDLDDPGSGMTKVTCKKGDYCLIELNDAEKLKSGCRDAYDALLECSAFVNYRLLEIGNQPLIMLAFR